MPRRPVSEAFVPRLHTGKGASHAAEVQGMRFAPAAWEKAGRAVPRFGRAALSPLVGEGDAGQSAFGQNKESA